MDRTGTRRKKGIGLEIPATHSFYHKKPSKGKKLINKLIMIRDKEDRAEVMMSKYYSANVYDV